MPRRAPLSVEIRTDFKPAKRVTRRLVAARKDAAMAMAQAIARGSQRRVPRFTGRLADSMRITPRAVQRGYVAEVSYGARGRARDYALVVHEEPQSRRRTGERHYLAKEVERLRPEQFAGPPLRRAIRRRT